MQTVLWVEDDDAVRRVVSRMLVHGGYTVLAATGGYHALQIAERHEGRIHLLVTDVVMPGLSGVSLVKKLICGRPDLAILYVSGYLDDSLQRYGLPDNDHHFMRKPLMCRSLIEKVRYVLALSQGGEREGTASTCSTSPQPVSYFTAGSAARIG